MSESYGFFHRLREDALRGVSSLTRSASSLVDRAFQETGLLQIRHRLRSIDRQLSESYRALGEKVHGRFQKGDEKLLSEEEAAVFFGEIERLQRERDKLASDIIALSEAESGPDQRES